MIKYKAYVEQIIKNPFLCYYYNEDEDKFIGIPEQMFSDKAEILKDYSNELKNFSQVLKRKEEGKEIFKIIELKRSSFHKLQKVFLDKHIELIQKVDENHTINDILAKEYEDKSIIGLEYYDFLLNNLASSFYMNSRMQEGFFEEEADDETYDRIYQLLCEIDENNYSEILEPLEVVNVKLNDYSGFEAAFYPEYDDTAAVFEGLCMIYGPHVEQIFDYSRQRENSCDLITLQNCLRSITIKYNNTDHTDSMINIIDPDKRINTLSIETGYLKWNYFSQSLGILFIQFLLKFLKAMKEVTEIKQKSTDSYCFLAMYKSTKKGYRRYRKYTYYSDCNLNVFMPVFISYPHFCGPFEITPGLSYVMSFRDVIKQDKILNDDRFIYNRHCIAICDVKNTNNMDFIYANIQPSPNPLYNLFISLYDFFKKNGLPEFIIFQCKFDYDFFYNQLEFLENYGVKMTIGYSEEIDEIIFEEILNNTKPETVHKV